MVRQRDESGTAGTAVKERPAESSSAPKSEAGNGSSERGSPRSLTRWPVLLGVSGTPASPWELMRRMSDEMGQLFESLGGTRAGLAPPAQSGRAARGRQSDTRSDLGLSSPGVLLPHIELEQRPGALVVRADLPGLRPEDINVTVDHGVLTISGERQQENREEDEGFIRSEFSYGAFFRSIPLPEDADESQVAAVLRNGVLEITVPVSDRQQGRRITVEPEASQAEKG
jgi:HSP20 family protein